MSRRLINTSGVSTASLVHPNKHIQMANQMNYLVGQGVQLIPASGHGTGWTAYNARTYRIRYYLQPSINGHSGGATQSLWNIGYTPNVTPGTGGTPGSAVLALNGTISGSTGSYSGTSRVDSLFFTSTFTATDSWLDLTFTQSATTTVAVQDITCQELPVDSIFLSPDGVSLSPLRAGLPITADVREPYYEPGAAGFPSNAQLSPTLGARTFFQWGVPYEDNSVVTTTFAKKTTATSATSIFSDNSQVPVLARFMSTPGTTTATITVRAFAWVESGGSGKVYIKNTKTGSLATLSVTSTTPMWYTSTLSIDSEDVSNVLNGGTQSSLTNYLDFSFQSTTSGRHIYVSSLSVTET